MGQLIRSVPELEAWRHEHPGTLALCDGVFDLFHIGHLAHLQEARKLADALLVVVASDNYGSKAPGRPVYNQEERAALLSGLQVVDVVIIVGSPSSVESLVWLLRPEYYVKGADYRDKRSRALDSLRELVGSYGGKVVYTTTSLQSSSAIANGHLPVFTPRQREFLKLFKSARAYTDDLSLLDQVQRLRVRVEGDAIIDKYIFVQPEGKSPKENLVTYRHLEEAVYPGGALIMGQHLAAMGAAVTPVSDASAITKTRYVTGDFRQKVFSVAYMGTADAGRVNGSRIIPSHLYDMCLVGDFGHGRFPARIPDTEDCLTKWMALTVQSNSLNWGFNLLTKWPRAAYVAIDEQELRLAARDRCSPVQQLAEEQILRMRCERFAVTLGHKGCMVWDGQWTECPAWSDRVIDRMGAGDAFLAVTAPLAYLGACGPVMALVGSLAAAQAVATLGNQPIDMDRLKKTLRVLMA